jgi:hypothetical protein
MKRKLQFYVNLLPPTFLVVVCIPFLAIIIFSRDSFFFGVKLFVICNWKIGENYHAKVLIA